MRALQFYSVPYASLGQGAWSFLTENEQAILDRMRQKSVTLEEATAQIFQGLITSADTVYHLIRLGPGRYYSHALEKVVELEDELMKPLVSGEDAVPFATPPTDTYLLFPYQLMEKGCRLFTRADFKPYKRCWQYLRENESTLRARESGKFDDEEWWRFGRHQSLDKHELPKIGVPETVDHLFTFIDNRGERYFNNVRVNGILEKGDRSYSLLYLLGLLNSRALDYYFRLTAKPKDRGYFEANKQFIKPLPIPATRNQAGVEELSQELADLHGRRLTALGHVVRRFVVDLSPATLRAASPLPPRLPGKLQRFDELPMPDLIAELQRFAKHRFKPAERAHWDQYLTKEVEGLAGIKRQIEDRTAELNARVYKLYGLSPEQIRLIEESLKKRSEKPK